MCWTWYYGDWALFVNFCTPCTAKPAVLWMLAVWHTAHILKGVISETDSTWIHLLYVYLHREWTCKLEVGPFCWRVCHSLKNSVTRLCVFCHCVGCDVNTRIRCVKAVKKCLHVCVCVRVRVRARAHTGISHCKMNSHNLEQIINFKFFPKLGGVRVKPLQCCLKHKAQMSWRKQMFESGRNSL